MYADDEMRENRKKIEACCKNFVPKTTWERDVLFLTSQTKDGWILFLKQSNSNFWRLLLRSPKIYVSNIRSNHVPVIQ